MKKNFWQKLKKPILALAPMAGITDSAFRQICKQFGADVVYSEMISVDGLQYGSQKTLNLLKQVKAEQPVVFQLFGKRPQYFALAAKIVEQKGGAGVDINFGCPATKIYKCGGGVKLMRDLNLCYEIVKAACLSVKIPVSIKIRTSIKSLDKKKVITAIDLIKKLKDLRISAIMVHGRSYEQGFSGEPDYLMIKKIKQKFNGLVLGNGGIINPMKAKIMLDKTGVDGFGLAQGVLGKPWLFKQIKQYLQSGTFQEFDWPAIKKIMLQHAQLTFKDKGKRGIIELRKHLAWYAKGFTGAADLRKKLIRVNSLQEIKEILDNTL
jgi:nifR3 family TIM-barrel protein